MQLTTVEHVIDVSGFSESSMLLYLDEESRINIHFLTRVVISKNTMWISNLKG